MNLAQKYKIYPMSMVIASICLALSVIIQNITIATILNETLHHSYQNIVKLCIVAFIVLILRATFNSFNLLLGHLLSGKVKHLLRTQIISQRRPSSLGVQMNTITESVDGMSPFFNNYLPQFFKSVMIPLFIIIAMCFIHLNTALIMMVTAPFIPLFYIIFGLKTRDESKDKMTYLNQFSQRFLNKIKGLITLKLFNQTKQTEQNLFQESTTFRDLTMRILRSAFLSGLMLEFITMLGIGLVALEAGLGLIVFHSIDFKVAAIAMLLAPEFYNAIKDLGQSFHTGKQSEGASDVVFELIDQQQASSKVSKHFNQQQSPLIKVDDVSFKYNVASSYVLKNINLDIFKGEHIALVGQSGAGKSTLVQLISSRYRPNNGVISYQSPNIKMGVLSQSPYIFSSSLRNNITMFREIDESVIVKALQYVDLYDKVMMLEDGLDTQIGEGGEMLSGGQMRRVELCRILVDQPDIIIFDEPATGLDIHTETIIQQAIAKQFSTQTIVTIAHRPHTIQHADRVIHLQNQTITNDSYQPIRKPNIGGDFT